MQIIKAAFKTDSFLCMAKYTGNLYLSCPSISSAFCVLPRPCDRPISSLLLIGTDHCPETVAAGTVHRSHIFGAEGYFRLIWFGAVGCEGVDQFGYSMNQCLATSE